MHLLMQFSDIFFNSPMWLNEHTVDIVDVDGVFLPSERFDHTGKAEVSYLS